MSFAADYADDVAISIKEQSDSAKTGRRKTDLGERNRALVTLKNQVQGVLNETKVHLNKKLKDFCDEEARKRPTLEPPFPAGDLSLKKIVDLSVKFQSDVLEAMEYLVKFWKNPELETVTTPESGMK